MERLAVTVLPSHYPITLNGSVKECRIVSKDCHIVRKRNVSDAVCHTHCILPARELRIRDSPNIGTAAKL